MGVAGRLGRNLAVGDEGLALLLCGCAQLTEADVQRNCSLVIFGGGDDDQLIAGFVRGTSCCYVGFWKKQKVASLPIFWISNM